MTRTASIGSRVPPALITTLTPTRSPGPSTAAAAATIDSGEASRPAPTSPPANRPLSGSTMWTPRSRKVAMLSATAGCSHISVCIAGQIITGARVASSTLLSRSVDRPIRYAAMSRAVAGATRIRSADWPSLVCGIGVSGSSQSRVRTGSLASADSVVVPRNRSAPAVITGMTWAPASTKRRLISTALYAAIPPVTPRTMRLPSSIVVPGAIRPRRRRRAGRRPRGGRAGRRPRRVRRSARSCRRRSPRTQC